jgi:rhodanese-related sulfurtransferase
LYHYDEWDTARLEQFTLMPMSQMNTWTPTVAEDFDTSKPTYVLCKAGIRSMRCAMAGPY